MPDRVTDIKGVDAGSAQKLVDAGIKTIDEFLAQSGTQQQRAALANQIGVAPSQLTEWVNRADLMRVKGVGKEFANLLEECGVDSLKELRHRRPENLQAAMSQKNGELKITQRVPTLSQVQAWIDEAKTLSATTE